MGRQGQITSTEPPSDDAIGQLRTSATGINLCASSTLGAFSVQSQALATSWHPQKHNFALCFQRAALFKGPKDHALGSFLAEAGLLDLPMNSQP